MTYSLGNSLTSISSLTTLPPSPGKIARPTRSADILGPSDKKPTDTRVDPLNLLHSARSPDESMSEVGSVPSVPSPRPKFAHLIASAPSRPRLPRQQSFPGVVRPRIPSPLNPARLLQKPATSKGALAFTLDTGSVPRPKPNQLFTSLVGCSPPNKIPTDPRLPPMPKLERCPPRLTNGQKSSAPRRISPPRPDGPPRRVTEPVPRSADAASMAEPLTKAPNSFSTFFASITSLK
jgi:hypothetical protein